MSELFNMSIMECIFLSCLKFGRVIPIFESGRKGQMTNYRPITTPPVSAKFFEKLAHKRIMCFINRFNLINTNQFGFLAGQNTADAVTEFLDETCDAINQNRVLLTLFLDFSKAFDTVDHEIFLMKNYITMASEVKVWTDFAIFQAIDHSLMKLNGNVLLLWM